jgi:hypothetical protein
LADGHPFKVCAHGIHFALVDTDAAICDERGFSVVQLRGSVAVGVIANFVIVPDGDPSIGKDEGRLKTPDSLLLPRELLMRRKQVKICAISSQTLAVIVQRKDFMVRERNTTDSLTAAIIA